MPQINRNRLKCHSRSALRSRPHEGSLAAASSPGQLRTNGDIRQCHRIEDSRDPHRPTPDDMASHMIDSAIRELAEASHTDEETMMEQIGVEAGVSPEIVTAARTGPLRRGTDRANIIIAIERIDTELREIVVAANRLGPRLQLT